MNWPMRTIFTVATFVAATVLTTAPTALAEAPPPEESPAAPPASPTPTSEVVTVTTKGEVDIGLMYNGDFVYFFGTVPSPDADVIVKLTSVGDEPIKVNRKGRVGLFWMNVKQFEVTGLPLVYKIHSTRPLADILTPEMSRELGLGYEVLKERVQLKMVRGEPADDDRDMVFDGVLKLKKESNLYNIDEKRIEVTGGKIFKHNFRFPPAAKEGKYTAESYMIKDGKLIGKGVDEIVIQKTGLEATFTALARNHPIVYGILCVIVALGMGLLVGVIFKKGGGH
jgi:uncharacterized protein (TIGR02186 family)